MYPGLSGVENNKFEILHDKINYLIPKKTRTTMDRNLIKYRMNVKLYMTPLLHPHITNNILKFQCYLNI